MRVTVSLDDELVNKIRKIATERNVTLTSLIREHFESLTAENAARGRRHREREALEKSFSQVRVHMGKPTWKRNALYERP